MKEIIKRPNKNWRTVLLKEVCVEKNGIQTGPFGSQLHQKDYVKKGTPIITVEHLGEGRIIHKKDVPRVSSEDENRLSKFLLREGDIVLSRVGSVDITNIVTEKEDGWLFSGRCLRIRPDKAKVDPKFLSYYLRHPRVKKYLLAFAVGATMPSLNTKIVSNIPVNLPEDTKIMDAISQTFFSIEEKIELHQKMNLTLEEIGKTIFKSWFIDFDPVRAKAEGRPTGLSKEISDLFPDSFEESEFGKVPTGWQFKQLNYISDLKNGYAFKSKNWKDHGIPVVKISNVKPTIIDIKECSYVSNEICDKNFYFLLKEEDILIGMTGYVGEVGLVPKLAPMPLLNQRVGKIIPHSIEFKSFIFFLMRSKSFKKKVEELSQGSAQQNVSSKDILSINYMNSSKKLIKKFSELTNSILKKILKNYEENLVLSQLRDALLSKLISGELKIPDAEKFAEKVDI